jgi:hypothetical protein
MKAKRLQFIFFISLLASQVIRADSLKGVWTSVTKFPLFHAAFWQGIGQGIGFPPKGYVYSFEVYNDMRQPVYFSVCEIMSIMGGDLPRPHGFHLYRVPSFQSQAVNNQEYYFELLIKSTNKSYSSNMPYLLHADILCRYEAIELNSAPHSQKIHYYRSFIGKKLQNGVYVHGPAAEYVGFLNQDSAEAKQDPGDVTIGQTLNKITIHNSTDTDFYVGFASGTSSTALTSKTSQAYALVKAHSFALLEIFNDLTSLVPGTFGLFDATSQNVMSSYILPTSVFENMPYTLEIYQDPTSKAGVAMDLQGIMSGNYDVPMGNVRDITPVTCVFWWAMAKTAAHNLPGKVCILLADDTKMRLVGYAQVGQAVQWNMTRPLYGQNLWIYFIYVASEDATKVEQYVQNFTNSSFGLPALQSYKSQARSQIKLVADAKFAATKKIVPQNLLVQAAQGILSLKGGQIVDPTSGIAGYLLGGDVFLASGVGAGPMYYYLGSGAGANGAPFATVKNIFISTAGSTQTIPGMPTPIKIG